MNGPIGVFDSGVGGLTVVRALWRRLPRERIIYFGDTARVPYGSKSPDTIRKFSIQITSFLLGQKIKMLVVACNTASAWALDVLKKKTPVPVLGVIEPGAAAALRRTRSGRIGVIGTHGTIMSGSYEKALRRRAPKNLRLKIFTAACPLFVPLAEEGVTSGPIAEGVVRKYLKPMMEQRVDTLLLGCTHYPVLAGVIHRVMGPRVEVVDSATAVAAAAEEVMLCNGLAASGKRRAGVTSSEFFVSDRPLKMQELGRRFLGQAPGRVRKADLDDV